MTSAEPKHPPGLTIGDSAVIALKASQAVVESQHFRPYPEYSGIGIIAKFLNRLPVWIRRKIADYAIQSTGHPHTDFLRYDPEESARWVVAGYPRDKYPGVILGAPGLSAVFLSGLTGFPFLPQPLLHNARRDMRHDDAQAYLDAGLELAEPVVSKHKSIEATIHFDPVHDRFLIGRIVFIRIKFLDLPKAYREFIEKKLVPGASVILLDCRYPWPRASVGDRVFFQLGGLGGVSPQEYIEETEPLREYRERWGGTRESSWKIDRAYSESIESEWGSVGHFLDQAEESCIKQGHNVIKNLHYHPSELSSSVFRLYENCFTVKGRPERVYISTFSHMEPRFPLVTGALPIWLPFITDENLSFLENILTDWRNRSGIKGKHGSVYMSLHPSFCFPPDMVGLPVWRSLLEKFFENVEFPGTDPSRYPCDLGCHLTIQSSLAGIASRIQLPGKAFRTPERADLIDFLCR